MKDQQDVSRYSENAAHQASAKEKADEWLARTPCSSCGSRYPNIACNQCRPEWIISLDEANLLVNEVTETRARMADIRDKLTDLRKALNRRPGSLLEKQITDAAICLTNANVDLPDTAAQDSASKSNSPAVSG